MRTLHWSSLIFLVLLINCGPKIESTETGLASYYADFFQGRATASGIPYDTAALTAAHRDLPLGTVIRVTNLENNQQTTVTVNDRGPYNMKRIIDLSKKAAIELDMIEEGVVEVKLEIYKESSSE